MSVVQVFGLIPGGNQWIEARKPIYQSISPEVHECSDPTAYYEDRFRA